MSQVAIPTNEQVSEIIKAEKENFIKCLDYDKTLISVTDDGAVANIEGDEIPLLDVAFDIMVVQSGHGSVNPQLSSQVGKIMIVFNKDDYSESEFVSELSLVPITIVSFGYRYFSEYSNNKSVNGLLCYSNNGVFPSSKVASPVNNICSELVLRNGQYIRKVVCPKAQWLPDSKKPACGATVTLGFFDINRFIPIRMQLHSTGLGAWNQLQRSYKQVKNVARLKKKSISDYIIKLTVENKGSYNVPVFKLVEAKEDINPAKYLPVCKYYMSTIFANKNNNEQIEQMQDNVEKVSFADTYTEVNNEVNNEKVEEITKAQGFCVN